jgi:hypothetical protein
MRLAPAMTAPVKTPDRKREDRAGPQQAEAIRPQHCPPAVRGEEAMAQQQSAPGAPAYRVAHGVPAIRRVCGDEHHR